MCDGHRDLYQNIEVLQRQVKALMDRQGIEDLSRTGGEAVRFPHARREE